MDEFKKKPKKTEAAVLTAVEQSLVVLEAAAKRNAPIGAEGLLVRSIHRNPPNVITGGGFLSRATTITGVVESDAKQSVGVGPGRYYSEPVEVGSEAHWPPWKGTTALGRWALRVLGSEKLAYVVARSISIHGTSKTAMAKTGSMGYYFMRRAVKSEQSRIDAFFGVALASVVRK
jgi:hypothetical protein